MAERWFELKLANGKRAHWPGTDGVDAARRYVDVHRDATVVAFREDRRPQIRVGLPPCRDCAAVLDLLDPEGIWASQGRPSAAPGGPTRG